MSDNRDIPPGAAPPAAQRHRTDSTDSFHSQEASLSTTPTQSQIQGLGHASTASSSTAAAAASGTVRNAQATAASADAPAAAQSSPLDLEAWQRSIHPTSSASEQSRPGSAAQRVYRDPSLEDSSHVATIGRGQPPPPSSAGGAGPGTPRPALSRPQNPDRDTSQSQRSVSYAPSDFDTVSGASVSEYSSGNEDDQEAMSRSVTSRSRGRMPDHGARQVSAAGSRSGGGGGTGGGGSGRYVLDTASPAAQQGTGNKVGTRRPSATNTTRDSSRTRRHSQAPRSGDRGYANDDGDDIDDRYGPLDEEDDEVEIHDRGEELVRRRMKARQREKALRKKREKQAERERNRQSQVPSQAQSVTSPGSPRLGPGSGFSAGRPVSPSPRLDRAGRPSTIMLPPSAGFQSLQHGALSPGSQPPLASPGGGPRSSYAPSYPSPHAHIRRPSASYATTSLYGQQQQQQQQQQYQQQQYQASLQGTPSGARTTYYGGGGQQAASLDVFAESLRPRSAAGKASTDAGSSVAGSVRESGEGEHEGGDDDDEERDTIVSLADRRGQRETDDEHDGEDRGYGDYDGADGGDGTPTGRRQRQDGGEEGQLDDEDEDDDEEDLEDGDDVEYTLKDRQDAINVEHPFGLPIWKPALYKKSRSVTRNAESALHLIPSAAAERHLLPGNILWTVFFGWWLAAVCYVCAILINFVPVGGSRYARVIWELGGYLFWPFGKYVEVEVDPESADRSLPAGEFRAQARQASDGAYETVPPSAVDQTFEQQQQRQASENRSADTLRPSDAVAASTTGAAGQSGSADESSSGGSDAAARRSLASGSHSGESSRTSHAEDYGVRADGKADGDAGETTSLKGKSKLGGGYGAVDDLGEDGADALSNFTEQERIEAESAIYGYVHDDHGNEVGVARRAGGKLAFGLVYGLVVFPLMGLVCLACWGGVFSIPMAKLTWALIKNLAMRPLALHFRSAPGIERPSGDEGDDEDDVGDRADGGNGKKGGAGGAARNLFLPLKPGQIAPRSKSFSQGKGKAKVHRRSKILLCTYRAVGSQYYKYTVGGVNILFVNTLPLVFFTIFDFFVIEAYVERHGIHGGFLGLISGQGVIFLLALASVIPLSYFIGMAVASISAQSSIGMGAVINATFGSIIEIILYAIALTQQKARLVEGSLIGSILAGVLLMPGLSMCSGATRRKEQRFNARSAGVTSTMLIMAIIGILTPTLFYQIYGTFQLTCEGCPRGGSQPGDTWTCKRCFYEHVDPATDPFFQQNVRGLMYTCTVILVLSYGIGLWFSLRTHASQIWQNPQPAQPVQHQHQHQQQHGGVTTAHNVATLPSAQRASIYKRLVPPSVMQQLLPTIHSSGSGGQHGGHAQGQSQGSQQARPPSQISYGGSAGQGTIKGGPPQQQQQQQRSDASHGHGRSATGRTASEAANNDAGSQLRVPEQFSREEYERAVALTASAFHTALQQDREQRAAAAAGGGARQSYPQADGRHHASSSLAAAPPLPAGQLQHESGGGDDDGGHGGHDAPSWSRGTSVSVLLGCTVLYAIIAEILVDVVDVVLDGSGIDEKFLGITLFALVPNTTEFMNAMSFAINGNIALSMEIGSAYALQVCLIQIPAMVAFSAYYNGVNDVPENVVHQSFTLIFPRWDVIAIIFSVFLLTYTYIEARSNYYRGSICILSYVVLVAGFFFAPNTGDTEMPGDSGPGGHGTPLSSNSLAGFGGLYGGGAAGGGLSGFSSFAASGGSFGGLPLAPPSTPSVLGIAEPAFAPALGVLQWLSAMFVSLWAR